MNERDNMLKKLAAYCFAEKEWNLYLDTHPFDKDGLRMHKKMAENAKKLAIEFENKFGPLTTMNSKNEDCFDWIDSPWPWEK